jgi:hypothetical protein
MSADNMSPHSGRNFAKFGQCVLVNDLKKIKQIGVLVDDKRVKGTVAMITCDNLGSHCIGGFVEHFSSCMYVCKYCFFKTEEIEHENVLDTYSTMSPENYQNDLHCLEVTKPYLLPNITSVPLNLSFS